MIQSQDTRLLEKHLQQDAALALAWLKRVESGEELPPEGFNWLGFAEVAAFDAASENNLLWAEVAVLVYDRLAVLNANAKESLTISSMLLRAALIFKFGSIPGHPVIDINRIIQWFWDGLTISRDEAEKKAANWKTCQIEEIRELRKIKNRLKILSILDDSEQYQLNEDLKAWLSIREKLP